MQIKKHIFTSFVSFLSLLVIYPLVSYSEEGIKQASIQNKTVIRAVEPIKLISDNLRKTVNARIDTGATQSSIDIKLAKELGFNKVIGQVNVVSANGVKIRTLVEVYFELAGKKIKSTFTLADRSSLNYSVLIGRNDLKGFLVDPVD